MSGIIGSPFFIVSVPFSSFSFKAMKIVIKAIIMQHWLFYCELLFPPYFGGIFKDNTLPSNRKELFTSSVAICPVVTGRGDLIKCLMY